MLSYKKPCIVGYTIILHGESTIPHPRSGGRDPTTPRIEVPTNTIFLSSSEVQHVSIFTLRLPTGGCGFYPTYTILHHKLVSYGNNFIHFRYCRGSICTHLEVYMLCCWPTPLKVIPEILLMCVQ